MMRNDLRAVSRRAFVRVFLVVYALSATAAIAQNVSDQITGQAERIGNWQATTILAAVALISLAAVVMMAKFIVDRDKEDRALFLNALREHTEAVRWCKDRRDFNEKK